MQLTAAVPQPEPEKRPYTRTAPFKGSYAFVEFKSMVRVRPGGNKGPFRETTFTWEGIGEKAGWVITVDGPWVQVAHKDNRAEATLVPVSNVACLHPHTRVDD